MLRLVIYIRPFARHLLIAWLLAIIIVSSLPSIPTLKIHTSHSDIRLDYLIHFCEYGILAAMAFLSFTSDAFNLRLKKYFMLNAGLIAFAILDEFHQKFIPGRSFNPKDIYSNITGILAAFIFCLILFRLIRRRMKNPS